MHKDSVGPAISMTFLRSFMSCLVIWWALVGPSGTGVVGGHWELWDGQAFLVFLRTQRCGREEAVMGMVFWSWRKTSLWGLLPRSVTTTPTAVSEEMFWPRLVDGDTALEVFQHLRSCHQNGGRLSAPQQQARRQPVVGNTARFSVLVSGLVTVKQSLQSRRAGWGWWKTYFK